MATRGSPTCALSDEIRNIESNKVSASARQVIRREEPGIESDKAGVAERLGDFIKNKSGNSEL